MKKIKLNATGYNWGNGTIISKEQAEMIIADLQAQLDAPEPVEFWEGQLVEVWNAYDNGEPRVQLRTFCKMSDSGAYECYMDAMRKGATYCWGNCRPLQDPLVLQFKPIEKGGPEGLPPTFAILVLQDSGRVVMGLLKDIPLYNVIGWMPADGWGTK